MVVSTGSSAPIRPGELGSFDNLDFQNENTFLDRFQALIGTFWAFGPHLHLPDIIFFPICNINTWHKVDPKVKNQKLDVLSLIEVHQ